MMHDHKRVEAKYEGKSKPGVLNVMTQCEWNGEGCIRDTLQGARRSRAGHVLILEYNICLQLPDKKQELLKYSEIVL